MYLFIGVLVGGMALLDIYCTRWLPLLKVYLYSLLSIFLFIIIAYRECGFDYDSYMGIYQDLHSSAWINNASVWGMEWGYGFLNYICTSFRQLLIVMAFLTVTAYAIFVYRYSPLPFFSLFLFLGILYGGMMGQYRQSLAVGIVLLAVSVRKSRIAFISLLAIAVLFHTSAVLAVILLFLPEKLYSLKSYLYLMLLALVGNLVGGEVLAILKVNLPDIMQNKLEYYTNAEAGIVFGFNLAMLLRIFVFGYLWKKRDLIGMYPSGFFFFNAYFLSLFFYLGLGFLPQLAGRGTIYFSVFEFMLPTMVIAQDRKARCGIIAFFFISIYRQLSLLTGEGSAEYLPYRSALEQWFGI